MLLGFLLKHDLLNPELRLVLVGAGGCPPELLEGVTQKGIRVSFGYGLTETSSGVALSLGKDPMAMIVLCSRPLRWNVGIIWVCAVHNAATHLFVD